jgi:quercetin dioxygenase-like cupin family protein
MLLLKVLQLHGYSKINNNTNIPKVMPVSKENSAIPEQVKQGFKRRITHLDNLMVVVCDFTNGPMTKPDPPHSHPHQQITYVAEGELFLFLDEKKRHLSQGDIFLVPSDQPHCIQTISGHVRLIDCFSPIREDFLK